MNLIDLNKIKNLMEIKSYTMYRLAKLSGVPESSINRLLWDKEKDIKVSTLVKIADTLEVSVDELIKRD